MIRRREEQFADIAFRNAMSQDLVGKARVCAAIILGNRLISFGRNQKKTHPIQQEYKKNDQAINLHAEIDAIIRALKFISVDDLAKSTLIIARAKKAGSKHRDPFVYGLAKPCAGCRAAIAAYRIRKVIWTTDEQTLDYCVRDSYK